MVGLVLVVLRCGGESAGAPTSEVVDASSGAADAEDGSFDSSTDSGRLCTPRAAERCYAGPADTEDVGACKSGLRVCAEDGSGFGECVGAEIPVPETCATPVDDDCDGKVNEGGPDCKCVPGEPAECYSGPLASLGVGACKAGTQVCNPSGTGYGACYGEVIPTEETCSTSVDDDCDGELNEEGDDCVCVPGSTESCYSGPTGTQGVGACIAGTRTCDALGTAWSPCIGEIAPVTEQCATAVDDDCDGDVNEDGSDCICAPGSTVSCYSGPSGTEGVGICASGTQSCNALGNGYTSCEQDVTPKSEACSTWVDDDCDDIAECPGDAVAATTYTDLPILAISGQFGPCIAFKLQKSPSLDFARLVDFDANGIPTMVKNLPDRALPMAMVKLSSSSLGMAGRYTQAPDFGSGPLPHSNGTGLFVVLFSNTGGNSLVIPFLQAYPNVLDVSKPLHYSSTTTVAGFVVSGADLGTGPLPEGAFVAAFSDGIIGYPPFARPLKTGASGTVTSIAGLLGGVQTRLFGTFQGTVDFGTGPLTGGSGDVFLLYLNTDGSTSHVHRFGGPGVDTVISESGDQSGFNFIAGTTAGGIDFGNGPLPAGMYVARPTANGTALWADSVPGCSPITIRSSTHYYVVADCTSVVDLGNGPLPAGRVLIAYDDSTGAVVWSRPIPTTVEARLEHDHFLVGRTNGTVDFGTGASVNGPSVFLARFLP